MNNFLIKNVFVDNERNAEGVTQEQVDLWKKFISWANGLNRNVTWSGDSIGDHYGIIDEDLAICGPWHPFPDGVEVITIEQWHERYIASLETPQEDTEEDMVTDYKGELIPLSKAREFSEDSRYAGEFFHEDEYLRQCDIVSLDYGDGYALRDECSIDINDCYFVTDHHERYNLEWSEYNNNWVCTDDDYVCYGYTGRSNREEYFYNTDYVEIGGEYYADSDVARQHGWIWSDRQDCYVHEDDWDEDEDEDTDVQENNGIYHRLERQFRFVDNPKFSVGFEIEKEDSDAGTIDYRRLHRDTGWCKEADASLNNYGYELVSPAFDLYTNDLEKEIKCSNELQTLINGGFSSRCGGHINVASSEFPNKEHLFEALSGFFPLLYAIYPNRVHEDFCRARKKHEYYVKNKRSAIHIKDNVVEFRIFPAVRNYNNLIWRRDLMRIMCDNVNKSEGDVLKMLVNSNSRLHKHLRKIYTHDALIERIERFIDHSSAYNNKKLPKVDLSKQKQIVANGVNSDDLAC